MRDLFRLLLIVLLLLAWPVYSGETHAAAPTSPRPPVRKPAALSIAVQPTRIEVGRDVPLRIAVLGGGRHVSALINVTGAGTPRAGTAAHGTLTLVVHATALGNATIQASAAGYPPALARIPIVAGSPATVMAIKRGLTIQPPHSRPRTGQVGNDLLQDYHARTTHAQLASLGLRDGTLVDLNSNTDVLIKDPLHTTLNGGEVFLEVVHGSVSHQVQAGTAIAATKGTRLDVRYNRATRVAVVTVVEGLVRVSNRGASRLVGAGQQTTVAANRAPSPPKPVNLTSVVGWVTALPNSSSTVVPPILSPAPPPPLPVPAPPAPRTPNLTLTGTLATASVAGVVLITGTAVLPAGATLTIAPGTLVELGPSALLQVDGTLDAAGTASAPIVLTSDAPIPQPGDWQALRIEGNGASGTILSYVHAYYGGSDNYYGTPGMVLVRAGAAITIAHALFAYDARGAISVDDGSRPSMTDCSFADDPGTPINAPVDLLGKITDMHLAPGQTPITPRPGTIATTVTWLPMTVPVVLTGTVVLAAGVTLTLTPGITITFGPGALLQVDGTLHAAGTAAAPITFTSAAAQPAPGDWQDLRIEGEGAAKSVLDHVQVYYGGRDNYYGTPGALLIRAGANIAVADSTFAQDSAGAIYVDDGSRPTITNCLFAGDPGSPIDAPVDTLALFTGLRFAADQTPIVARPGTISTSATWLPSAVPEVITGTVVLAAGATLTIAPGTVIAMGPGALLQVDGTLKAVGTAAAPIVFTSAAAQPAPGDWQDLRVEGDGATATTFDYVDFLYGGTDRYYGTSGMLLIRAGAAITVADSTFAYDSAGAITIDDGSRPRISNCSFVADAGNPLNLGVDMLGLIANLHFAPGQGPVVARPGTISTSASWTPLELPLVITGTVVLAANATLTIAPGTVIAMGPGALFQVDGVLHAVGTASSPITFTSAAPQPRAGDWQDLRIEGTAAAATTLSHVQVLYGGNDHYYGVPGVILIRAGANVTLADGLIAHGANGGIYVDNASLPTITANHIFDVTGAAIAIPAADQAKVRGNTFGPGQQQVVVHT